MDILGDALVEHRRDSVCTQKGSKVVCKLQLSNDLDTVPQA